MKKITLALLSPIVAMSIIIFLLVTYFIFNKVTDRILGFVEEDNYACNLKPKEREFKYAPYYTGPLIDTHVHMPVAYKIIGSVATRAGFEDMPAAADISTGYINCLFESEGITKAFGFFIVPNLFSGRVVDHVENIEEKYPGKFVKFFMPNFPLASLNPKPEKVDKIMRDNPGLYEGYGELRLDFNFGKNADPEDLYLLEMFAFADEYNLIVQIHPDRGQLPALERLLNKYPNVKFLAHVMPDAKEEIGKLMEKYNNLYYSLDAEIHYIFGYHTIQNNRGPTKEAYLKFLRENFDSLLKEALSDWQAMIKEHPDRFMWGSDRWFTWHFDPEVGGLVTEFGRTFIGHLDPAVQENFAYKNAEGLFQER